SVHIHINEVITGLVGVAFIGASLASSVGANRRDRRRNERRRQVGVAH
ncbi:DUF475 domain-containing protein, partial [Streptomyces sp. SID10244]|nr:DUF475 domain-containing protein [Streptomyces sp. SID10244]